MKKAISKVIYLMILTLVLSTLSHVPTDAATKYYTMFVHYIDVGESDCVLIESDNKFMLIDAGDTDDEDTIIDYLKAQKVKTLDYVICTHPHADHIGSMDEVIKEFNVGKIIMPAITHTTKVFEDLLDAIEDKGLKITKPVVGREYTIGKADFTIIAPNDKYSDLNNNSVGIKLVNGKNSFVFIGDCEKEAISDILDNDIDINADSLMLGHHGSDTSTTSELLDAVSPDSAIISVGKNSYGHPSESVLEMLKNEGITTYRTDENGTIVATSTGTKITFDAKAAKIENTKNGADAQAAKTTVYITDTGTKYHKGGCSYLKKSKIKMTLKDAKNKGLEPCSRCNPPR
jgi:competence protein ComEC